MKHQIFLLWKIIINSSSKGHQEEDLMIVLDLRQSVIEQYMGTVKLLRQIFLICMEGFIIAVIGNCIHFMLYICVSTISWVCMSINCFFTNFFRPWLYPTLSLVTTNMGWLVSWSSLSLYFLETAYYFCYKWHKAIKVIEPNFWKILFPRNTACKR